MEFIDHFLKKWLDDDLDGSEKYNVSDMVFCEEELARRARELIEKTEDVAQRTFRDKLFGECRRYSERFERLMGGEEEDSSETPIP